MILLNPTAIQNWTSQGLEHPVNGVSCYTTSCRRKNIPKWQKAKNQIKELKHITLFNQKIFCSLICSPELDRCRVVVFEDLWSSRSRFLRLRRRSGQGCWRPGSARWTTGSTSTPILKLKYFNNMRTPILKLSTTF